MVNNVVNHHRNVVCFSLTFILLQIFSKLLNYYSIYNYSMFYLNYFFSFYSLSITLEIIMCQIQHKTPSQYFVKPFNLMLHYITVH